MQKKDIETMLENEKELLKSVTDGSEGAFREVFSYYYPKVLVFLSEILKDRAVAEDIAQDVFAKIWLLRDTLPEIHAFGSYLYTMTRNSALLHLKKRSHSMTIEDFDFAVDQTIDSHLTAAEKAAKIREAVENMPERRRRVFTLSRNDGKSNDEIAEILGIKKKTVENLMNAALRDIRRVLCLMVFFV